MNPKSIVVAVLAVGVLVIIYSATYLVRENNQVIITQFGNPVGDAVTDPGLQWKLPWQDANYFEKRFLEWDGDPNQVPTRDKRFIWVDTYARWRIDDPLKYFQRLRDERAAQSRLDDILDGETRNAIARHDLVEVVRSTNRPEDEVQLESEEETAILSQIELGRAAIMAEILEAASGRTKDLGIELLDLRFKRINYVEEVRKDVYQRMIAERKRIAARYLSEGEGEAARIRGEKERDLQRIQSEAYRTAEEVRGNGDAEATTIYANAYNRAPGFYSFLKTMEMYEKTSDPNTILIMTTDAEFLKYMKNSNPR